MEHDGEKLSQPAVKKIRLKNKLKAYPITSITMTFSKPDYPVPRETLVVFFLTLSLEGILLNFLESNSSNIAQRIHFV